MDSAPAVVINKPSFFGTFARSLRDTLAVILACVVVLGGYGVHLSAKFSPEMPVREFLSTVDESVCDWHTSPLVLATRFADHRDLGYRDNVCIKTKIHAACEEHDGDDAVIVVEVANNGDEVISLLTARLRVEGEGGERVDLPLIIASPFAVDDQWRGPLLPGTTRRIAQRVTNLDNRPNISLKVFDLRIWNRPTAPLPPSRTRTDAACCTSLLDTLSCRACPVRQLHSLALTRSAPGTRWC